jgi:dipeptidyl aminopeptidase/acylaminoacyl peptidase
MCTAGRDLTEPRPAPDGHQVAVVVRWGRSTAIVVMPVDGGPERLVTSEPAPAPGRGWSGGCFDWLPDGSGLIYAAVDGALWLQPFPGGAPRRLAVHDLGPAQAPCVAPDGRWVAYAVDHAEIWRVPLAGGDPERLDDGTADFCADPWIGPDGAVCWQAWNVPDMPWDGARVEHLDPATGRRWRDEATGAIQQPRTTADGRSLCVRDDTGYLNLWLEDEVLVEEPFEHAGPSWGMGQRSYAVAPDGTRVAFTRNEAGFGRLCVVDLVSGHVDEVARGVHGQLAWVGDRLTALRSGARTPTQVVSYTTLGRPDAWQRRTLLVGPVLGWDAVDLVEPETFTVDVDGTEIHARRYAAGQGRVICWIHGGPADQWQVEFYPRIAYWCAQGWDVVVPDPRGSTGHGRAYQQELRGEWGRLDVDDTAAVVAHAHRQHWADPEHTVVMGGSSGGLIALGLLGRYPGLAAAGVVLYPVSDLADLPARSHRFEAHATLSLVGPLEDVATYRDRSPITRASWIEAPILVMHGDLDDVVPVSQSLALADEVRAAGGEVDLHVMTGEGHGFRDPATKLAEYELIGAFLDRTIGVHTDR